MLLVPPPKLVFFTSSQFLHYFVVLFYVLRLIISLSLFLHVFIASGLPQHEGRADTAMETSQPRISISPYNKKMYCLSLHSPLLLLFLLLLLLVLSFSFFFFSFFISYRPSKLRQLVTGLSPRILGFDPSSRDSFMDIVALAQGFLPVLQFPLLVSFHQCSILISILIFKYFQKENRTKSGSLPEAVPFRHRGSSGSSG